MANNFLTIYAASCIEHSVIELNRTPIDRLTSIGFGNRTALYIELTISFLIGQKRRVNFRNQHLWCHLAADSTIIMSRTLKVTDNDVMYNHGAWCLRVYNHVKFVHFVLLPVSEEAKTCPPFFFVQCVIKQFKKQLNLSDVVMLESVQMHFLFWNTFVWIFSMRWGKQGLKLTFF